MVAESQSSFSGGKCVDTVWGVWCIGRDMQQRGDCGVQVYGISLVVRSKGGEMTIVQGKALLGERYVSHQRVCW